MRNPFKRKADPEPVFTGNCYVREYTGDGEYVGNCYHSTYDGRCPRHGSVAIYLDDIAEWPRDFELPKWDGNKWAEGLRAKFRERPKGDCPRGTPGCIYSDCSGTWGKSCYGPNAPRHIDMGN